MFNIAALTWQSRYRYDFPRNGENPADYLGRIPAGAECADCDGNEGAASGGSRDTTGQHQRVCAFTFTTNQRTV
jgi:hypothetical protein